MAWFPCNLNSDLGGLLELTNYDISTYTTPTIYNNRVKNVTGGYKIVKNKVFIHLFFTTNSLSINNAALDSWALFGDMPSVGEETFVFGKIINNSTYTIPSANTFLFAPYITTSNYLTIKSHSNAGIILTQSFEIHGYYEI